MYTEFCIIIVINLLCLKESRQGIIHRRVTRGLLSRTGLCPNPHKNFQIRDNRLNFYGTGYLLPADASTSKTACEENECSYDSQCRGDQRCCKNVCGASVCTEALRDPHPCSMFTCPDQKVCKLQRVRCIYPECPDLYAVPRPICVPSKFLPGKRRSQISSTFEDEQIAFPALDPYIYPERPYYHPPEMKRDEISKPSTSNIFYHLYPENPYYKQPQ